MNEILNKFLLAEEKLMSNIQIGVLKHFAHWEQILTWGTETF